MRPRAADLLCLAAPFAALLVGPRREVAAGAACIAVLLLPGVLLARLLFPQRESPGAWLLRLAFSAVSGLALFGVVTFFAARLHWRLDSFLIALGIVEVLTCAGLAFLGCRSRVSVAREPGERGAVGLAGLRVAPPVGVLLLVLAGVALLSVGLGRQTPGLPWWAGMSLGLAAGLLAVCVVRVRRRRGAEAPVVESTARGAWGERGAEALLWLGVGLLTWHLMAVAYERRSIDADDVTHVGRAADFLTGEPMDRFEPSLGEEVPMDPAYPIPTTSLLVAVVSRVTGTPPDAHQHTILPPVVVLLGVASLVGLVAVGVRGHRLLVPLASLVVLAVLVKSSDGHRSLCHLLFYRPLQPRSLYLLIVAPVQLASLLLLARQPRARHLLAAGVAAVAGHLVHPWGTVALLIAAGSFVLSCLMTNRKALVPLIGVVAVALALGGTHYVSATYGLFGPAAETAGTPSWPIELATPAGDAVTRLDPALTFGRYSLLRLGVLAVPWVILLAWRQRELWGLVVLSVLAVGLAYLEPLSTVVARVIPESLLWRGRFVVPAALNAALVAVAVQQLGSGVVRAWTGRATLAALSGTAVVVAGFALVLAHNGSALVERDGSPVRLSKLEPATHRIVEALGGREASAHVLTPPRLSLELPQLMPRVRVVISRALVVQWFLGAEEMERRRGMLRSFYEGTMSKGDFDAMRREFPIDWVVLDWRMEPVSHARRVLRDAGAVRHGIFERYELWRLP